MSFIPNNQALEPSLTKMIEGISEFREASLNRMKDNYEWSDHHLKKINDLSMKLISFEAILYKLKIENW